MYVWQLYKHLIVLQTMLQLQQFSVTAALKSSVQPKDKGKKDQTLSEVKHLYCGVPTDSTLENWVLSGILLAYFPFLWHQVSDTLSVATHINPAAAEETSTEGEPKSCKY